MSQKTKFNVICADPCWNFNDSLKMSDVKRGASSQYKTLSVTDIKNLKVAELSADDAILVLWVPSSLLQEGLDTMKAWGFEFKQTLPWIKLNKNYTLTLFKSLKDIFSKNKKDIIKELFSFNFEDLLSFGMGRLFRQSHEIALIGIKGKIYSKLKNKSQRSVIFGINFRHSQKPEVLQDKLELMFPSVDGNKYLELFARRARPGWTCLGNEVPPNEDIRDSINKLL